MSVAETAGGFPITKAVLPLVPVAQLQTELRVRQLTAVLVLPVLAAHVLVVIIVRLAPGLVVVIAPVIILVHGATVQITALLLLPM